MEYTKLGKSGLKISRIGLGMMSYGSKSWRPWVLEEEEGLQHVKRALELGINFFDTANMYSVGESEVITGKALKKYAKREEVVIATKVHFKMGEHANGSGLSRKHIMDQVDASLKRLQTDYIDLYQIHRWDYETPIEETLAALHDLVKMGKVRYIGASSMHAYQFCKALYIADLKGWTRFIAMQNHYNLAYREEEREMNPLCIEEGIGLIPWSPLARGLLVGASSKNQQHTLRSQTDKIAHRLYTEHDFEIAAAVKKVAEVKNISPAQVALAWLLQRPGVAAPIVGTTKLKHLEVAIEAINIQLSKEEITILEKFYRSKQVAGHQ